MIQSATNHEFFNYIIHIGPVHDGLERDQMPCCGRGDKSDTHVALLGNLPTHDYEVQKDVRGD